MLGYSDILAEKALTQTLKAIQEADPDTPAERFAAILPNMIPLAQRLKWTTRVLEQGIRIRQGATLNVDDLGPTVSIVCEQGAAGPSPLAFGSSWDPTEERPHEERTLSSSVMLQFTLYGKTRDDVRALNYFVKSAMLEMHHYLTQLGIDNLQPVDSVELRADERRVPEGTTLYGTRQRWSFFAMETIYHVARSVPSVEGYAVVSELGTEVDAVVDMATRVVTPLPEPVEGGMDPQEQ